MHHYKNTGTGVSVCNKNTQLAKWFFKLGVPKTNKMSMMQVSNYRLL